MWLERFKNRILFFLIRSKSFNKGSAVMMAAITSAAITGLIGVVLTKMWNVNFNALNVSTERN